MNKEQCDKDPAWHKSVQDNGIKNICSHCSDKDSCTKEFKQTWE